MSKRLSLFLLVILFLSITEAKAQTQGCLIGAQLWTYNTSGTLTPTDCGWYPTPVGSSSWNGGQKNQCTGAGGTHGAWIGLACPIDDYIPFFGVLLAGSAVYFIRRQNFNFSK